MDVQQRVMEMKERIEDAAIDCGLNLTVYEGKIAFEFLPEKFTLSALQRVYEIIGGEPLLCANFRRKTSNLVIETDDFTEGAGHRPARLFVRKY